MAALKAEPNARWCPKADCETPVIADPSDPSYPKLVCPSCEYAYCFLCAAGVRQSAANRGESLKTNDLTRCATNAVARRLDVCTRRKAQEEDW